ncbi:M20 metallopeptidase family protein [Saccharopolyspora pogona]|uniref:M20 metallopeptidase family protein n=1 Tax=Saccharopolyspora pogona TaxID=333966 RepID=UPI001687C390|nr:M20 family metallopeptidase [Saccharopolyspora pogona]
MNEDLIALRRSLHAAPEVGLHLPRTQQKVLDALDGLPLKITTGIGCTSVTAVLEGARPGPAVLLRGDMDALPVREDTGLDFAATGAAMHACGHDLHTAALVGAARLLSAEREVLAGKVVFMFQPGEEGHGGAQLMLDEGLLDAAGARPDFAYALHVLADRPRGLVLCRPGPVMAAYSVLDVTVEGRGGHGGRPHEAHDPVPALAEIVTALYTYVARRFDSFDPVVLTVGEMHAGSAPNVIPDNGFLKAGVRTFSETATTRVAAELPAVAGSVAAAHGLTVRTSVRPVMAPTVNDPVAAAVFADTAIRLFGAGRYRDLEHPRAGSEDFSLVLREIPGAYGYLGAAEPGATAGNHSPRARFDDSVLPDAAALLAGLARHHLNPARKAKS